MEITLKSWSFAVMPGAYLICKHCESWCPHLERGQLLREQLCKWHRAAQGMIFRKGATPTVAALERLIRMKVELESVNFAARVIVVGQLLKQD